MYVFEKLKLTEQRGLGFKTIKSLPSKYKLPLPIVSFEDPYLIFAFPRSYSIEGANGKFQGLSEKEIEGYDFIHLNGNTTRSEYADYLGIGDKTAVRQLGHMVDIGLIVKTGAGRSTSYETAE